MQKVGRGRRSVRTAAGDEVAQAAKFRHLADWVVLLCESTALRGTMLYLALCLMAVATNAGCCDVMQWR
jgi:hypothetical protein